jgi:hypothetical protein
MTMSRRILRRIPVHTATAQRDDLPVMISPWSTVPGSCILGRMSAPNAQLKYATCDLCLVDLGLVVRFEMPTGESFHACRECVTSGVNLLKGTVVWEGLLPEIVDDTMPVPQAALTMSDTQRMPAAAVDDVDNGLGDD